MNKSLLAIAIAFSLSPPTAWSVEPSLQDRLERMEQRLQYLENRVASQDDVIREKDRQIAQLSENASSDGRFQSIELGGMVEIEAGHTDPFVGNSENDIVVTTVELGIAAQVNDWVDAEVVLLYEEDDTPLEVDVAVVNITPPDSPFSFTGGQFYVPFGVFESNMVSDPMTLEIGEARESAVMAGFDNGGFNGAVYVFNGDNKQGGGADNKIDNFGATLGFMHEGDGSNFAGALGYINDIGDSDGLQGTINDNLGHNDVQDQVPGWFASGVVEFGDFMLIGEYVAATDDFQAGEIGFGAGGAQPEAFNLEVGYATEFMGKGTTLAIGYQGTNEALAIGLPEERIVAAVSIEVMDNVGLGLEWAHDKDYSIADGGTGNNANTLTAQVAVEF